MWVFINPGGPFVLYLPNNSKMKHTTSIGYRKFKALDDFVSKKTIGKSKTLVQYNRKNMSIEVSIKKKQELDFDTDLYTVLSSIEDTIRERYVK